MPTYEQLLGLKPMVSETSGGAETREESSDNYKGSTQTDSKLAIDFSYLANNSSFQRAIIEFIKKFIPGFENVKHRGSKKVMTSSFNENMQNYRECMKELKEVLKKRHE